jgi:hypothetical protein
LTWYYIYMDNNAPKAQNTAQTDAINTPITASVQSALGKMQEPPMRTQTAGQNISVNLPEPDKSQLTNSPVPSSAPTGKEHEPVSAPFPDVSKMSETQIIEEEKVLEKELNSIVEKSPDLEKPKIPEEAKQAGLTHAKENTPMPVVSSGNIILPMTYEEAKLTRKKYRWRDSVSWFTTLIMYHWKKMNLTKEN